MNIGRECSGSEVVQIKKHGSLKILNRLTALRQVQDDSIVMMEKLGLIDLGS